MNNREFRKSPDNSLRQRISEEWFRQAKMSFNLAIIVKIIVILIFIISLIMIFIDIKFLGAGAGVAFIINNMSKSFINLHKDTNDRFGKFLHLL
jgi:hypothetical protein